MFSARGLPFITEGQLSCHLFNFQTSLFPPGPSSLSYFLSNLNLITFFEALIILHCNWSPLSLHDEEVSEDRDGDEKDGLVASMCVSWHGLRFASFRL